MAKQQPLGVNATAVYTFAGARAGDKGFADAFDATFPGKAYRFEYQDDIVPHVPPSNRDVLQVFNSLGGGLPSALRPVALVLERFGNWLSSRSIAAYKSAGILQFIDWNNTLADVTTHPDLDQERLDHLRKCLEKTPGKVAADHLPTNGYGYMEFLMPHR